MKKFTTLEHLKTQVTVVRWHLDAAASEHGGRRLRRLDSAGLTYHGALELASQLALPEEDHTAVMRQLAQLGERLRAAGRPV